MARIHILEQAVADRIAAGEVVERPASVVKELIENALDAVAREIVIEIAGAGVELIRVSDNGAGIDPQDLRVAVQRFATSKLTTSDDLVRISSLGFRGEALPSIAAVSHLEITSAPSGAGGGRRLRVRGGTLMGDEVIGAPQGTRVDVRELFYNTPARRKFLKSSAREFALILEAVNRLALAYPEVAFRLLHGGDEIARYPAGSADDRLAMVLGVEAYERMVRCEAETDGLTIGGWLGRPELARSTRTHQYAFVNRRPIQSRIIAGAIEQAFQQLLPSGQFPLFVVFVQLPAHLVDVNIHPRKLEVRFDDDHRVFGAVLKAAKTALRDAQLVRVIAPATVPIGGTAIPLGFENPLLDEPAVLPAAALTNGRLPRMRLLGQLHATYLLAQGDEGLIIIDQHAAHERVLYERLLRARQRGLSTSQGLVAPVAWELTAEDVPLLTATQDALDELGFVLEPFGDRTVLIRAVPQIATRASPGALLRELLHQAASGEHSAWAVHSMAERLTIATACHTAIKAGDVLTAEAMVALLRDLAETAHPFTCFHGRPTIVTVPISQLERWFLRT